MLALVKLQTEGKLQKGDVVRTNEHGQMTVAWINNHQEVICSRGYGQYVRLSGICFPSDTVCQ